MVTRKGQSRLVECSAIRFVHESEDGLVHRSLDDAAVVQPSQTRLVPCLHSWVHSFRETTQTPTCMRCMTAAL